MLRAITIFFTNNGFFAVVLLMYDVDVFKENVVMGNDALMKCQIPSLVSDLSSVDSWVDSNGNEILATESFGNFKCS